MIENELVQGETLILKGVDEYSCIVLIDSAV